MSLDYRQVNMYSPIDFESVFSIIGQRQNFLPFRGEL